MPQCEKVNRAVLFNLFLDENFTRHFIIFVIMKCILFGLIIGLVLLQTQMGYCNSRFLFKCYETLVLTITLKSN